jgi:hypothetical protein
MSSSPGPAPSFKALFVAFAFAAPPEGGHLLDVQGASGGK